MDAGALSEVVEDLPVLDQREYNLWGRSLERHYIVILGEIVEGDCQLETEVHCAVYTLNREGYPFDMLEVDELQSEFFGYVGAIPIENLGCEIEVFDYDPVNTSILDIHPEIMEPVEGREARWILRFICIRSGEVEASASFVSNSEG